MPRRPRDRVFLHALVDLLHADGRDEQVEKVLAEASQRDPQDIDIIRRRVSLRKEKGDFTGAGALLVGTVAANPDLADQLQPVWEWLLRPSARGRLRLAELRRLQVRPAEQQARLFCLARAASTWHRNGEALEALSQAVASAALSARVPRPFRPDLGTARPERRTEGPRMRGLDRSCRGGLGPRPGGRIARLDLAAQHQSRPAAEAFTRAVEGGARSPEVLLARALALHEAGDEAAFESALWKLVSDWPGCREGYLELYSVYENRGSALQAERILSTWLAADPGSVTARRMQAREYFAAGRAPAAEAMLLRLLDSRPDDPEVIASLRAVFDQAAKPDALTEVLKERQRREPGNLALLEALVDIYHDQRKAEATALLDAARQRFADDPDVLYEISGLYAHNEDKLAAEQVLEHLVQLDPSHAGSANDLGYSLADRGERLAEAESLVRRALHSDPHNASFLDTMGWVLYKRARFDAARVELEKATGGPDSDPVVFDHLGDTLYRLRQPDPASAAWQHAADRLKDADADRDDLKVLRLQLQKKLQQIKAGRPVSVAPAGEGISPPPPPPQRRARRPAPARRWTDCREPASTQLRFAFPASRSPQDSSAGL